MKTSQPLSAPQRPTLFWYQIFSLLALTVVLAGVGGLSLVWLRQQITDTAGRIQQIQREHVEVDRRLEFLSSRIAELQRPDVLRDRAVAMGLSLRRPETQQIVRMGPLRMPIPLREFEPTPTSPSGAEPYRQTFDLAVMEPVRPLGR
jgi:cell division protein FtsL